jgi:hypothetical protein
MKRVVLCLLAVAAAASAGTVSGFLTADDGFFLYLSTSPTVTGTYVTEGHAWSTTYAFSGVTLTPGTTNYLQVDVPNGFAYVGLIGSFTLSDSSFQFANGGQSLNTDTTDWTYLYTGFGVAGGMTPTDWGLNGNPLWSVHLPDIAPGAEWIGDPNLNRLGDLYFTTEITSTSPEPGSIGFLGAGLVALGLMAWRKRAA